jgi:condensin complex subunit 1
LLGSKNNGDVTETIKLLLILYKTHIERSEEGIRKMLMLVWTKDKAIMNEVVRAYWSLFLDKEQFGSKVIFGFIYIIYMVNIDMA